MLKKICSAGVTLSEQAVNSLFPLIVLFLAHRTFSNSAYEFVAAAQAVLSIVPAVGVLIASNYLGVNFSKVSWKGNAYRLVACSIFLVLFSIVSLIVVALIDVSAAKKNESVLFLVFLATLLTSLFAICRVHLILSGRFRVRLATVFLAASGLVGELLSEGRILGIYWVINIAFFVAVAAMLYTSLKGACLNFRAPRFFFAVRQLLKYVLTGAAGYGAFWFGTVGFLALSSPFFGFKELAVIRSSHSASNAITAVFSSFDPVVIRRARADSSNPDFVTTWVRRYLAGGAGLYFALVGAVWLFNDSVLGGFFNLKILSVYALGAVAFCVAKVYSIRILTKSGPWRSARASIYFAPFAVPLWVGAMLTLSPLWVAFCYVLVAFTYLCVVAVVARNENSLGR